MDFLRQNNLKSEVPGTEEKKGGTRMEDFEALLLENKNAVERFVYCKLPSKFDGDDVLQEIYLTAMQHFDTLREPSAFKGWIMQIARNKCIDFYRQRARALEIPLEYAADTAETGFDDHAMRLDVRDALERLPDREKQILYLFYLRGISQKDISVRLAVPVGTVKSRLYTARRHFIENYGTVDVMEDYNMTRNTFSRFAPEYKIIRSEKPPFDVMCEEVPGWLVVARVGENQRFAFYDDMPDGSRPCLTGITEMTCVRNAVIHGVDCVQIAVEDTDGQGNTEKRELFVRLTETHCMYIADLFERNGVLHFASFMDDEWMERYEIGTDNCGRAIHQTLGKNIIVHGDGSLTIRDELTAKEQYELIGRYEIELNSRKYDTMAMVSLSNGILVMQYLDKKGRTILFRRFNRYDWQSAERGYQWTDRLPESERLMVNGEIYVHWYDCVTDYVMD